MATTATNSDGLKALLILHRAMLAGQLIFAIIVFYLVYSMSFVVRLQPQTARILQFATIILTAGGYYIGAYLFKRKLSQLKEMQASAESKYSAYRSISLLQWALIELPCLVAVICFLLTRNYAFLALTVLLIFIFFMMAPSKVKLIEDLQLSEAEISQL